MKAIMVMFDSLNRRMLPPYGSDWTHAPNFARLAERAVTFDNAYAGSLPCMPARRELHTGRYNFLHRSWGPLEPFDDSMPELLAQNGVYTHLASDHPHYWEDGGATYHGRYNSWEFFRGQEGDPWKGHVADPETPEGLKRMRTPAYRQDWINRSYMATEDRHPQTLTFDAGLEFIRTNKDADRWFVQIETFDPHEPFFSHQRYKDLYPHAYDGPHFDWPDYKRVTETDDEVAHARYEYAALLSMCDRSLGRVLDAMDELELWDDTLLIVNTDHGFLLGEKGWWAKWVQPWYSELVHLPLFAWDPRRPGTAGERRESLVQTIDLAPTILEYFGVERPADMQGRPIPVGEDTPVREAGLFGAHGGHVNVTDGRYVYMRAPVSPDNAPLYEHTLMPTHMRGRFAPAELVDAELVGPFGFTKGVPTLRTPGRSLLNPFLHGTLLFDLEADPHQENPLNDAVLETKMATHLVELMRANDAPPEQYVRLSLPEAGPVEERHLLIEQQWVQVQSSREPAARVPDFPADSIVATVPISELVKDQRRRQTLVEAIPTLGNEAAMAMFANHTIVEAAAMTPNLRSPQIRKLEAELAKTAN